MPSSASSRGLIGNRIPSLDPKTAGMLGSQGQRKVSDQKGLGLVGNRIPSSSQVPGAGSVPAPSSTSSTRATAGSARSSSPASVDSSIDQPGSSNSPRTSRSSSPPSSHGGGLPPSLLLATLPETGGPGTTTPSSTRADIGEEVTELSPPATPTAATEIPQDDNMIRSDLTPNNLPANAVAANPMLRSLSTGGPGAAPSITSSVVSQFDSKGGSEDQTKMMEDVSGISTPMGTPRAAARDLEGSLAGSVKGEGSVADIDDLGSRLEGLDTSGRTDGQSVQGGSEAGEGAPASGEQGMDVDENAGPPSNETAPSAPSTRIENEAEKPDEATREDKADTHDPSANDKKGVSAESVSEESDGVDFTNPRGALANPDAEVSYTVKETDQSPEHKPSKGNSDPDPNKADDLDDLKEGNLHREPSSTDGPAGKSENPVDNLVEATLTQNIAEHDIDIDEKKHQGGVAGQRMQDVENADEIVQPDEADPAPSKDEGPEIREATPSHEGDEKPVATATVDDEPLGPRGSLDGPQKFEVEWLETGRGQEKAAELDKNEYHFKDGKDAEEQIDSEKQSRTDGSQGRNDVEADPSPPAEDKQEKSDVSGEGRKDDDSGDGNSVQEDSEPATKPLQVQVEPAPIAQPAADKEVDDSGIPDTSDEPTPSVEIDPPTFPAPPSDDPDVVDPISNADSGAATPLDPAIARAFPDVPDESKPRVQVHVSSPLNTPQKEKASALETATNATPLAQLPGKSKSLSTTSLSLSAEGDESGDGENESTPMGGGASGHKRRLSARKSPKSPLLGDEDPGDFEPGEGWAVVTKGRDI